MKIDPTIPWLDAYDDGDRGVAVWCVHCEKFHWHGPGASGHYVAHCIEDQSPYRDTGYYLRIVGRFADLPPDLVKERARLAARAVQRRRRRRVA